MQNIIGAFVILVVLGSVGGCLADHEREKIKTEYYNKGMADAKGRGRVKLDSLRQMFMAQKEQSDSVQFQKGVAAGLAKAKHRQLKAVGFGMFKTSWPQAFGFGLLAFVFLLTLYVLHDLYMDRIRKYVGDYFKDQRWKPSSFINQEKLLARERKNCVERQSKLITKEKKINNLQPHVSRMIENDQARLNTYFGKSSSPFLHRRLTKSKALLSQCIEHRICIQQHLFDNQLMIEDIDFKVIELKSGIENGGGKFYRELKTIGRKIDAYLKYTPDPKDFVDNPGYKKIVPHDYLLSFKTTLAEAAWAFDCAVRDRV